MVIENDEFYPLAFRVSHGKNINLTLFLKLVVDKNVVCIGICPSSIHVTIKFQFMLWGAINNFGQCIDKHLDNV